MDDKMATNKETKLTAASLAIHADRGVEPNVSDVAPPLHVSTTYDRSVKSLPWVYSREDQPTRHRVETVIGALESGGFAVSYSSGLASIQAVLLHYKPRRVMAEVGYHGTRMILKSWSSSGPNSSGQSSHEVVPLSMEPEKLKDVDLIIVESPSNPCCQLVDVPALVKAAKAATGGAAKVVIDSTFASPVIQRPLEWGVDLVMHSVTKYLGGHSDVLGGVLVTGDSDTHAKLMEERLILGSPLGTLESFLLLRSLRTLSVRVRQQSSTALSVAQFLVSHAEVSKVYHPALEGDASHQIYLSSALKMPPPCFAFETRRREQAELLASRCRLFCDATSLGGVESLLDWRYKWDTSLSPCLVRISIGLEEAEDLIADLTQAFNSFVDE